jgi:hypothetical protein
MCIFLPPQPCPEALSLNGKHFEKAPSFVNILLLAEDLSEENEREKLAKQELAVFKWVFIPTRLAASAQEDQSLLDCLAHCTFTLAIRLTSIHKFQI